MFPKKKGRVVSLRVSPPRGAGSAQRLLSPASPFLPNTPQDSRVKVSSRLPLFTGDLRRTRLASGWSDCLLCLRMKSGGMQGSHVTVSLWPADIPQAVSCRGSPGRKKVRDEE